MALRQENAEAIKYEENGKYEVAKLLSGGWGGAAWAGAAGLCTVARINRANAGLTGCRIFGKDHRRKRRVMMNYGGENLRKAEALRKKGIQEIGLPWGKNLCDPLQFRR